MTQEEDRHYSSKDITALQRGVNEMIKTWTAEAGDLALGNDPGKDKQIVVIKEEIQFMRGFCQGLVVGAGGYPMITLGDRGDRSYTLSRYLSEKRRIRRKNNNG